jgi:Fe-S cluster assembly protein SufD
MDTLKIENKIETFRNIDKNEPDWLYNLRKENWEHYNTLSLPERITNVWRYSKPDYFMVKQSELLMHLLPLLPDGTNGFPHQIGIEHAAVGYNREDLMTITKTTSELRESGVIFKDLLSAARENEDLVSPYLGQLVNYRLGKFEALNLAFWNTGLFLYIPDNMIIEKPIMLNRHPGEIYTLPRLLVVIGRNAEVSIIDDYSGQCHDGNPNLNSSVEIFAGDSSRVRYLNLQRLSSGCTTYITQRAQIEKNAFLHSVYGGIGSNISKVNGGVILNDRGAQSRISGVIFGDNKQHFDYHTFHHHKSSESYSNIDIKVILKDKATSAYTGLIRIEKEAANCEAYQENRNLLLNKGTKAESIPELEILNDQVRCTHGATMGPIDPEMLFYLESRGFNKEEAIREIAAGYVEPTISQIPGELRNIMRDLVLTKLKGGHK